MNFKLSDQEVRPVRVALDRCVDVSSEVVLEGRLAFEHVDSAIGITRMCIRAPSRKLVVMRYISELPVSGRAATPQKPYIPSLNSADFERGKHL